MTTSERIEADIKTAMKAKDTLTVTTLRMAKSAIHNKTIEKRVDLICRVAELNEQEVQAVLNTMVKQRLDSIVQFLAGERDDLANKEKAEIEILTKYMPAEVTGMPLVGLVETIVAAQAQALGRKPGPKDMGSTMKNCQAWLAANNARADGKKLSQLVKEALA